MNDNFEQIATDGEAQLQEDWEAYEKKHGISNNTLLEFESIRIDHNEVDLKDFSDKLPMEDIKPICLRAISEVMRYGRRKYGSEPEQKCSYENGEIDSYVGALLRHLNEYQYGNYTDPESELPHLWHVLMNAYIIVLLDEKDNEETERVFKEEMEEQEFNDLLMATCPEEVESGNMESFISYTNGEEIKAEFPYLKEKD